MDSDLDALSQCYSRDLVVKALREALQSLRGEITADSLTRDSLQQRVEGLADTVAGTLARRLQPSLSRVINATGVLIHTNIGRAPVSAQLASEALQISSSYTNLEYDLALGKRGSRHQHLEPRIQRILGCEAALVCNNNAAAIHLILNTFAMGRTVLVSRGELVEIGGSFRIPDIMKTSGVLLREVGTTNKTRISDFESAIDDQTGLILSVHPSNYRIVGFTESPSLRQLASLAKQHGIPFLHDVGSGLLFPSEHPALREEPNVQASVDAGVDLICFSGDKLLGGPQAGIVVGRSEAVARLRKNPIMRAVRVDKTTYALLDRTFIEFENGRASQTIPIQRMLHLPKEEIERRAERVCEQVSHGSLSTQLTEGTSLVGGGSAPERHFETCLIALESSSHSANQLEVYLRSCDPPIVARIENDRVLMDLRSVAPDEDGILVAALNSLT